MNTNLQLPPSLQIRNPNKIDASHNTRSAVPNKSSILFRVGNPPPTRSTYPQCATESIHVLGENKGPMGSGFTQLLTALIPANGLEMPVSTPSQQQKPAEALNVNAAFSSNSGKETPKIRNVTPLQQNASFDTTTNAPYGEPLGKQQITEHNTDYFTPKPWDISPVSSLVENPQLENHGDTPQRSPVPQGKQQITEHDTDYSTPKPPDRSPVSPPVSPLVENPQFANHGDTPQRSPVPQGTASHSGQTRNYSWPGNKNQINAMEQPSNPLNTRMNHSWENTGLEDNRKPMRYRKTEHVPHWVEPRNEDHLLTRTVPSRAGLQHEPSNLPTCEQSGVIEGEPTEENDTKALLAEMAGLPWMPKRIQHTSAPSGKDHTSAQSDKEHTSAQSDKEHTSVQSDKEHTCRCCCIIM